MRVRATEWAERVRAWKANGSSADEFARGKPFTGKMLGWWAGEFARRSREKPTVAMARVIPRDVARDATLAVQVAGTLIAVRRGFDPELLREVVDALGARR